MSKEIQQILEKLNSHTADSPSILATVVDVKGSSYRLPGARMLISETGETSGTVSGGCLESDVLEHARKVLGTNKPTILTYDTILVNFVKPSVSTSMEVLYGWERGKNIILVASPDACVSPWLVYHSHQLF